jgi:aspartyl/asparaginyl-tRNA synthetase
MELHPFTSLFLKDKKVIRYNGNKIYKPINDIRKISLRSHEFSTYFSSKMKRKYWENISRINSAIYFSTVEYFKSIDANFVTLPLTTRLLSSPGAAILEYLRGIRQIREKLDIEVFPMKLDWFGHDVFLSESSQLYLEFTLAFSDFNHVFSIYNSFRREKADWCHLSEFHHIEYEGKVNQEKNEKIIENLVSKIIKDVIQKCENELLSFVDKDYLRYLENNSKNMKKVSLYEALQKLHQETGLEEYKTFSTKYWGSWEEVKISNMLDSFVFVKEIPYFSSFFYQTYVDKEPGKEYTTININGDTIETKSYENVPVADTADLIWPGYREFVGSGHRVRTSKEARYKINWLFQKTLKIDEKTIKKIMRWYDPYIDIRDLPTYKQTSGFGLGWERFLQGLLKLPTIVDGALYARTHHIPKV